MSIAAEPYARSATFLSSRGTGALPLDRFPPLLSNLYRYWTAKRGFGKAPSRAAIDPADFPSALPSIILWDVHPGGAIVCRLAGTRICDYANRPLRGAYLEEFYVDDPIDVRAEFEDVINTLKPHYVERRMSWVSRYYHFYRRLILPLSNDGKKANMLLNVVDFSHSKTAAELKSTI